MLKEFIQLLQAPGKLSIINKIYVKPITIVQYFLPQFMNYLLTTFKSKNPFPFYPSPKIGENQSSSFSFPLLILYLLHHDRIMKMTVPERSWNIKVLFLFVKFYPGQAQPAAVSDKICGAKLVVPELSAALCWR